MEIIPEVGNVIHLPLQEMLEVERRLRPDMFLVFSKLGDKYRGVIMGNVKQQETIFPSLRQLGAGDACSIL
jgi:hypothetical protein